MSTVSNFFPGLDGVIAAETKISFLDTVQGEIVIKGYDLIELSKKYRYLDIVHLLLEDKLPSQEEKNRLENKLKSYYEVQEALYEVFKLLPEQTHPMDALRTGISFISGYDQDIDNRSLEVNKERAYRLLGTIPNIVANSYRILTKEALVQPDKDLSYSANFYYMITGRKPTEMQEKFFDLSLVLYSEHEMPNS